MYPFVIALHILVCFVLVLVIIMQPGKGGDGMGGMGGGATAALFGPQGPTNLLQQLTTICAGLFMVTSITLAWYSSRTVVTGDVDEGIRQLEERRKEKDAAPIEIVPTEVVPTPSGAAEGAAPAEGATP